MDGEASSGAARPAAVRRHPRARRTADVLFAGLGLVLASPAMLLLAALIRLTSPGPALLAQTRLGQHGRRFSMYKFRTMRAGCSDDLHRSYVTRLLRDEDVRAQSGGLYKLDDPRVTRFGAVLRRTSLDELPQLFNVVRGDMSMVGPRPMLPWEYDLLSDAHRVRFGVPAGITGLWQVSGRSRLTMTQALDLDVEYACTGGLRLDLQIVARTVLVLLVPGGRAR